MGCGKICEVETQDKENPDEQEAVILTQHLTHLVCYNVNWVSNIALKFGSIA